MWRLGLPPPPSVLVDMQRDLQWEDFRVRACACVHPRACVGKGEGERERREERERGREGESVCVCVCVWCAAQHAQRQHIYLAVR